MNRDCIISELKNYFDVREFVDPRTYKKHGEGSWQFLNTDLLNVVLFARKGIDKPFTANNWHYAKQGNVIYTQRGIRTNVCQIVKKKTKKDILYLSGHPLGMALDFKVKGMPSDDVRQWFVDNADDLPCKIRLENRVLKTGKTITWVHLDVKHLSRNPKVYLFNI
jgi:hypothetical protein